MSNFARKIKHFIHQESTHKVNSEAQENSKLSQMFNDQLDFITKPVALFINKAAVVESANTSKQIITYLISQKQCLNSNHDLS